MTQYQISFPMHYIMNQMDLMESEKGHYMEYFVWIHKICKIEIQAEIIRNFKYIKN